MLAPCGAVPALSTDKDQELEVEADSSELDTRGQQAIYRGNVVIRQGSLKLTGDVVTVHYDSARALQRIVIEGEPATYRQRLDDSDEHSHAIARSMEYHARRGLIVLQREVTVEQPGMTLQSEWVEYDTNDGKVRAHGRNKDNEAADDGRIRITIDPAEPP